jgi:ribosomal protein L9
MSYKIRNSIALGVIVLLVTLIGGYVTFFYQPKQIAANNKEAEKISAQLLDNEEQLSTIAQMQMKLRETLHRWNNRIKEISQSDVSSQTYGYLSDIINESGAQQLKMNLTLVGSKDGGKIGYNTYKINGTSEFPNILRFLWLLENGRKLYKVSNLTIRSDEVGADSLESPTISLQYEMEIRAFFTREKNLAMPVMRPDSTPQPITSNPFQPSILRKTPANVRNLVDVDKISVKATANGKALVMREDGRLITLQVGDDVYLGKVSGIYPQEGAIEFTLNDGGIVITKRKQIQFEKKYKDVEP